MVVSTEDTMPAWEETVGAREDTMPAWEEMVGACKYLWLVIGKVDGTFW